jgi:uncharacterized protein YqjF (DUF2071 family)
VAPTATSSRARSRRGPTGGRKAAAPPVIRQRWEDLLFLHWRQKPAAIARLLPPGLELDTYDGLAYVGLVPFTVPVNCLLKVPAPLSPPFHEVNLRTYVKGPAGDPAVWFFSLDASSRMASVGGSAFFSLPYHHAQIHFSREKHGQPGGREWIRFESRRVSGDPPDCAVRYRPAGLRRTAVLGTLEHFLIERYVLYAWTGTRLLRGRVRHEPYPLQDAEVDSLEERLFVAAGLSRPKADPLAHYARGVTVNISWPTAEEP